MDWQVGQGVIVRAWGSWGESVRAGTITKIMKTQAIARVGDLDYRFSTKTGRCVGNQDWYGAGVEAWSIAGVIAQHDCERRERAAKLCESICVSIPKMRQNDEQVAMLARIEDDLRRVLAGNNPMGTYPVEEGR